MTRDPQLGVVEQARELIAWAGIVVLAAAAPVRAADTALVSHGDLWFYSKGTNVVQADWKTTPDAGLDGTWVAGYGGFGFADNSNEVALVQTPLADMQNGYTTVFMRRTFQVDSAVDPAMRLVLTIDWDDGFIAWLDGAYLTNAHSPGAPTEPAHTNTASSSHESSRGNTSPSPAVSHDLGPIGTCLPAGSHILAIVGLNQTRSSGDFIQLADLTLAQPPPQPLNPVSGVIGEDVTWVARSNAYTLVGTLTVAAGATLTIEPGTSVYLSQNVSLVVADGGRLIAEGTPEAPINFTRVPNTTGAWGSIKINGSPSSPETRFAFAHFEGNDGTCLEVAGGTLYLDHATFGTTTRRYLLLDSSSFRISHCHFPSGTVSFELLRGLGGIKAGDTASCGIALWAARSATATQLILRVGTAQVRLLFTS